MASASFFVAKRADLHVEELVLRLAPDGDGVAAALQVDSDDICVLLMRHGGNLHDGRSR